MGVHLQSTLSSVLPWDRMHAGMTGLDAERQQLAGGGLDLYRASQSAMQGQDRGVPMRWQAEGVCHLAHGRPLALCQADLRPRGLHGGIGLLRAHLHLPHQVAEHQRGAAPAPGLAVHVRELPALRMLCTTRSRFRHPVTLLSMQAH